jgi:hypothetical protein
LVAGISAAIVLVALLTLLKPSPNGFAVALVFAGGVAVTTLAVYDRIDLQGMIDDLTLVAAGRR